MLIAVKSCEKHWDRCSAIRDTWWTPEVQFFTGNMLDVPDSYLALPLKTQAICRWAIKQNFPYATFVDTDTYLSVPRLLAERFPDYTGYRLHEKQYASGGAGYVLSRRAMEIVARCDAVRFQNEDEMVGTALWELGIVLNHDPRFSLFEPVLPDNKIISQHLSSRTFFEIPMMHEAHRRACGG